MELLLKRLFDENGIKYIREKKFDWLKYQDNLKVDFFLPDSNLVIECQGEQHFKPVKLYGGEEMLKITQDRDNLKYEKCVENGLRVQYIVLRRSKRFIKNDPRYKDALYYEDLLKDETKRIRKTLNIIS